MYEKLIETKIVKTRHRITFGIYATAFSIMSDLKHVPDQAKLIDFNEKERTMTFVEEKEEK